jgi:hypothetical protein
MAKNQNRTSTLNKHLTQRGAWSVDGNDRNTKAYRDHTVAGPARDIWDEVAVHDTHNGFSGEVGWGSRPKHVAGKRSYKRV